MRSSHRGLIAVAPCGYGAIHVPSKSCQRTSRLRVSSDDLGTTRKRRSGKAARSRDQFVTLRYRRTWTTPFTDVRNARDRPRRLRCHCAHRSALVSAHPCHCRDQVHHTGRTTTLRAGVDRCARARGRGHCADRARITTRMGNRSGALGHRRGRLGRALPTDRSSHGRGPSFRSCRYECGPRR